jgi:hypothetical protein
MNADAPRSAPDYETTDAAPRVVALTAFTLVLVVGLCLLSAAWVFRHRPAGTVAVTLAPNARFQHGPDERTGIEQAWQEQDRLVHEHLSTFGWVDRAAGVVHIPIDRAIDLMLAEQNPAAPHAVKTKSTP